MVSPLGKMSEGGPSSWVHDVRLIWIFASQILQSKIQHLWKILQIKWKVLLRLSVAYLYKILQAQDANFYEQF